MNERPVVWCARCGDSTPLNKLHALGLWAVLEMHWMTACAATRRERTLRAMGGRGPGCFG